MAGCSGCAKRAREAAAKRAAKSGNTGAFDPKLYGRMGDQATKSVSLTADPPSAPVATQPRP